MPWSGQFRVALGVSQRLREPTPCHPELRHLVGTGLGAELRRTESQGSSEQFDDGPWPTSRIWPDAVPNHTPGEGRIQESLVPKLHQPDIGKQLHRAEVGPKWAQVPL